MFGAASMFKAVREVNIGECTANQALKKQPLAWYLEDKKDSSRAEFFVTAFVCVCVVDMRDKCIAMLVYQ